MDTESELHRKAVDQVAHLLASYEAGKLSAEAFKAGIETIWACLGGVCDLPAFQELMHEANAEVAKLPTISTSVALSNGDLFAFIMRTGEHVRMFTGTRRASVNKTFHVSDEAVAHFQRLTEAAKAKGLSEITACE